MVWGVKNHADGNCMLIILIALAIAAIVVAIIIYDHFSK